MTVLSRQGIIEYMQRKEDPLEIYTVKDKKRRDIGLHQINEESVDVRVGTRVGELDLLKLQEELVDVFVLDRIEYIYSGGINPVRNRAAIEKSTRILDLSDLSKYKVEREGQGDEGCYSWKVGTKDDKYVFSTRITKENEDDKKASGIILHPEVFSLRMLSTSMSDASLTARDAIESIREYIVAKEDQSLSNRVKGLFFKNEDSENLLKRLYFQLKVFSDKSHFSQYSFPSTRFCIVNTEECVHMPLDLTGHMSTKSSFARLGLSSNETSYQVRAGFHNNLVLELKNDGMIPLVLDVGQHVAELQFESLDRPVEKGYEENPNSTYKKGNLKF
jgi:deoxycytidine triphosphate deaminase